jgi:hypothetical protein
MKKSCRRREQLPGAARHPAEPVIPPAPLTGDVGRGCGDASRALLFCRLFRCFDFWPHHWPHLWNYRRRDRSIRDPVLPCPAPCRFSTSLFLAVLQIEPTIVAPSRPAPCVGSDWLGRAVRRATSKLAGRLAKSLSVADGETFGTTSPDRPAADRWYRNNIRKAELKAGFNCAEL